MGGKGSGRLNKTDAILRDMTTEKVNPISHVQNEPFILPNHSGISSHPEFQTRGDERWVTLSTAQTITGTKTFSKTITITTGDIRNGAGQSLDLTGDGMNIQNDGSGLENVVLTFKDDLSLSENITLNVTTGAFDFSTDIKVTGDTDLIGDVQLGVSAATTQRLLKFNSHFGGPTGGTPNKLILYPSRYGFGVSSGDLDYHSDNNHRFHDFTSEVGGFVANKFGVGTTAPSQTLHISGGVRLDNGKTSTGDPTGEEGLIYYNTVDNVIKMYADGAWRTLASW